MASLLVMSQPANMDRKCCRLAGLNHLTGGGKREGRVTCATLMALCNGAPVEMQIDDGSSLTLQAGQPPIINGMHERNECGLAVGRQQSECLRRNGRVLLTKW